MTKDKIPTPEPIIPPPAGGPTPPDAPEEGPVEGVNVKRAKLGRGNMRRITKARDALDTAMLDFVKAMDPLVFVADEEGKRIGRWPLLDSVASAREHITAEISEVMAQQ